MYKQKTIQKTSTRATAAAPPSPVQSRKKRAVCFYQASTSTHKKCHSFCAEKCLQFFQSPFSQSMTAFISQQVTFCVLYTYVHLKLSQTINRQAGRQPNIPSDTIQNSGARFRLCFDFGKCLWVLERRSFFLFHFLLLLILAKNAASSNTVSLNKTA